MTLKICPVEYSRALFAELLPEAVRGDGGFIERLRDHWNDGSERFDRTGELLLGAFAAHRIVAVGGISLDPYEPADGLARLRHVYVLASFRGKGIGPALVMQLIEHARRHFTVLRLKTSNPAAARLYENLGFVRSSQGRETHRLSL